MTNWTIERGDDGAHGRGRAHAFTGMTLLMSTEELLAVLADGAALAPPQTRRTPERRLTLVPPIEGDPAPERSAPAPRQTDDPQAGPGAHRLCSVPAAPAPRPGLLRRLQCARLGHDPRPHRPRPHDDVVYRCLRCGRPTPR